MGADDYHENNTNLMINEDLNFNKCRSRRRRKEFYEGDTDDYYEKDLALMINEDLNFKKTVTDTEELLNVNNTSRLHEHEWCVDSGASKHMTNNINILSNVNYFHQPSPVYLGDKSIVFAHGEGQLRLQMVNGDCLILKNVLLVPKLVKNLLSVRSMTKLGAEVRFIGDRCFVLKDGKEVEIG